MGSAQVPLQKVLSRGPVIAVSPLCPPWPLASLSSSPSLSLACSCAVYVCVCMYLSLCVCLPLHLIASLSLSPLLLLFSISFSIYYPSLSVFVSPVSFLFFSSSPLPPFSLPHFLLSFLSIPRSVRSWDPAPSFPQPLSLTRPSRPTPTNQICDLIQLHQQKRRRVTLLISRLLEGGEEKMKIDFVLLLIRKIETLHLRSTEQHVVGTDVGSLHSCTGRGGLQKNVPKTASSLSCGPRPAATPGLMIPWENKKPRTWKGRQCGPVAEKPALNLNSSSATYQLCDLEFALNLSVP